MAQFETLHKYRETSILQYNESLYTARQLEAPPEEMEAKKAAFTFHMGMLDLAWTYHVNVEAMKQTVIGPSPYGVISLLERPVWFEFSQPQMTPVIMRRTHAEHRLNDIAALWFSLSEPRSTQWELEHGLDFVGYFSSALSAPRSTQWELKLIRPDGWSPDSLLYDMRKRTWGVSPTRAFFCRKQPCQRCQNHVRHWSTLFFEALHLSIPGG